MHEIRVWLDDAYVAGAPFRANVCAADSGSGPLAMLLEPDVMLLDSIVVRSVVRGASADSLPDEVARGEPLQLVADTGALVKRAHSQQHLQSSELALALDSLLYPMDDARVLPLVRQKEQPQEASRSRVVFEWRPQHAGLHAIYVTLQGVSIRPNPFRVRARLLYHMALHRI